MKTRILALALLLLAACAPIQPDPLAESTPTAPPELPGSGRVPGAPARTPVATASVLQGARGLSIQMTNDGTSLLVDIYSETGIGSTQLVLPSVPEGMPIILRLHLHGLEEWRFSFDAITTIGAVGTGTNVVSQSAQIGNAPAQPVDASSPYWMEVAPTAGEGVASDSFDLTLPPAFLASGSNTFTLSFVDFFR